LMLGCRQSVPSAMALSQQFDPKRRRRARAEPDNHVLRDQLHRSLGSCALKSVALDLAYRFCRVHDCAAAVALARMAAIAAA
jgi:hypothetical protein